MVSKNAISKSAYSKFDVYLFNTEGRYTDAKKKLFEDWGYPIDDAKWLQDEIEKQALQKYIKGDYKLGLLDKHGQRISIIIELPRKDGNGTIYFTTGWMANPNGHIQLNTPYGGK